MILKTLHMTKRYKLKPSLCDISLSLSEGKIIGVIGAENSGKTVLLELLGGRIKPDSGSIMMLGKPVNQTLFSLVSYHSQGDILPGFLTGKKLIQFLKNYYPDFDPEKSIAYAETLKINLSKKVGSLSLQTKELLKVILCFSRDTHIYLLDNPFMFVDSYHLDLLTQVIYTCTKPENCIVLTSRDPNILELVCDDFLILDNGQSIFYGDGEDFRLHRSQSMASFYKKAMKP